MHNYNYQNFKFLYDDNLYLVYDIALRFDVDYKLRDKLLNAGVDGLIHAISNFDIFKDVEFRKYACFYIIDSIKKKLKDECKNT